MTDDVDNVIRSAGDALAQGREAEAAALCERALATDPGRAGALALRAVLLARRGRTAEAKASLVAAALAEPGNPSHDYNLGCLLVGEHRLAEAETRFAAACEKGPTFLDAWLNLGLLYLDLDRPDAAEQRLRRVVELAPEAVPAWSGLGIALQRQGKSAAAAEFFRRARDIAPDDVRHTANLANVLCESGRYGEASALYRSALERQPGQPDLHLNLGVALFRLGNLAGAEEAILRCLELAPGHTRGLAMRAAILGESGRDEDLRRLIDFNRFLQSMTLTPPEGYPDLETFNRALAEDVRSHPSLLENRPSKATRGGSQTSELFGPTASNALRALKDAVDRAAKSYIEHLGNDRSHPFEVARPQAYRITGWGTVLREGGHQHPHNHPSAWLSGVYYVRLPASLGSGVDADRQGWIEFGEPDPEFLSTALPETRAVRPCPGLLILFPSYFWHRTVPFSGSEERISIAFDIVPAR